MSGKRPNGDNSIYQHKGRWYVQGMLHGKRRKVSRATQAEARKAWRQLAATPPTEPTSRPPLTVAETLEEWVTFTRDRWAYKTLVTYRSLIYRQIVPTLGGLPVEDVSTREVDIWLRDLQAAGCSASTVRQSRIILKQAFDMLVRHGALRTNPVLASAPPPNRKRVGTPLSFDEARDVIAAAPSARARARLLFGLTLGLRQGELLALRWRDVDLAGPRPRLAVTGSLHRETGVGLVIAVPKTEGSVRTLGLSPEHVDALKALRSEQAADRLAAGATWVPTDHVFTTPRGTPIDPANDRKHWFAWLDLAGVRRVRVHDARHTAATLLLRDGASLAGIQKTLGHSSIRTTIDIYGHLTSEDGAEATSALAAALSTRRGA